MLVICAISIVHQILWSLCVTPQVGGSPIGVRFRPPVNGPKDPWTCVLSLSGAKVVCWRPHLAGTRQYIAGTMFTKAIGWILSTPQQRCSILELDHSAYFAWIRIKKAKLFWNLNWNQDHLCNDHYLRSKKGFVTIFEYCQISDGTDIERYFPRSLSLKMQTGPAFHRRRRGVSRFLFFIKSNQTWYPCHIN